MSGPELHLKNSGSYTRRMPISAGLEPYSGAWTTNEVAHLLKRTLFGATRADIEHFLGLGRAQAVNELLSIDPAPLAPPLKDYDNKDIAAGDPDLGIAIGQTWVDIFTQDGNANGRRTDSLRAWWIGNMIDQDRTIREKMTLFWQNHFVTSAGDVGNARFSYLYNTMLRRQALGNLKTLTRAVTLSPAMLNYLNGRYNTAGAPDENFARELQELFTLGKENQPNYTEEDVKTVARVLTGWRVKDADNSVYFDPRGHDDKNKSFSSFYSGTTITGGSDAASGDRELDALMNMIFAKDIEVSRFIVTKLYRWFVYYQIDDATKTNMIEPLAKLLRDGGWEIKPVLSALLNSAHFFDGANQGCVIKSPMDYMIGFCRETHLKFPPASDTATRYQFYKVIAWFGYLLQQFPCDPPDVSGWKAYYQAPNFHEIWITSDSYPKRVQFADLLGVYGYTINNFELKVDHLSFAAGMPNPSDPNQLLNDVLTVLYRVPLSATTRERIKHDILLSGQANDYYWTNAWNAYIANPSDPMAVSTVRDRIKGLMQYLMNLAEYQLS